MERLKPYAKAAAGGLVAGLSALAPLMDGGVTLKEWVLVAIATLVGLGAVYMTPWMPNKSQ